MINSNPLEFSVFSKFKTPGIILNSTDFFWKSPMPFWRSENGKKVGPLDPYSFLTLSLPGLIFFLFAKYRGFSDFLNLFSMPILKSGL